MTDQQEAYHNATINGETPETLDPRHNTGSFRSPGKLLASRNTTSAQSSRSARPGRAGFIWWPSYIFDSLDAIKAGSASPQGQATADDLANFADRGRGALIFLMPRMSERGRTRYAGLGRCWLTSGGNGRLPRLEANGLLAEPGRSPRCGLFARCAGVHVDFHAHRYFDNLRSFPGHSFLPSILGAMWRRSQG